MASMLSGESLYYIPRNIAASSSSVLVVVLHMKKNVWEGGRECVSTHKKEKISSYKITAKQKQIHKFATSEKGAKSSKFLIQQKTTTGIIKMATQACFPIEMFRTLQKTCNS